MAFVPPSNSSSYAPRTLSPDDNVALWALIAAAFVTMLNETTMGVALPVLMDEMGVTPSTGQWLTAAFLLTMAVTIPVTGMLIQRVTTRKLFTFAMVSFLIGTVLCVIAPGFSVLLIGRIVQAVGSAILSPLLMTASVTVVPWHMRGQVMGRIAVVMSLAPAIGPTVSGLVLASLSWRWLFIIMLPIGALVLGIGLWKMRNIGKVKYITIDILSVIFSAIGFGALVYGLNLIGESSSDHTPISPYVPLAIGVVALVLFVWRQLSLIKSDKAAEAKKNKAAEARNDDLTEVKSGKPEDGAADRKSAKGPLLDLRVFTSKPYALSVVLFMTTMISLFGVVILLPIYAAGALGMDTLRIGLLMLPGGIMQAILGPIIGHIVDAKGARFVLLLGMTSLAIAMWWFTQISVDTQLWYLLVGHLLMSFGLSCTFTPLFSASLGSLPSRLASHGSATISTLQQVAGGIGTAVAISAMSIGAQRFADSGGLTALASGVSAEAASTTAGTQFSFLIGAIVATISIAIALFIKEEPAGKHER